MIGQFKSKRFYVERKFIKFYLTVKFYILIFALFFGCDLLYYMIAWHQLQQNHSNTTDLTIDLNLTIYISIDNNKSKKIMIKSCDLRPKSLRIIWSHYLIWTSILFIQPELINRSIVHIRNQFKMHSRCISEYNSSITILNQTDKWPILVVPGNVIKVCSRSTDG